MGNVIRMADAARERERAYVRDAWEAVQRGLCFDAVRHVAVVWPADMKHESRARVPADAYEEIETPRGLVRLSRMPAEQADALIESEVTRARVRACRAAREGIVLFVLPSRVAFVRVTRTGPIIEAEPELTS